MSAARRYLTVVLLATGMGLVGGVPADATPPGTYGRLPLSFEANLGQTDPAVGFVARSTGYQLFLAADEMVLVLRRPGASGADTLRITLVDSHPQRAVGVEALPGTVNYLTGRDPSAWRTGIPTYARVLVPGVYPGIDLVYYGQGRQLEYDFILAPGADPSSIRLAIRGLAGGAAPGLVLDETGDLRLRVPGGDVLMRRPVAYQTEDAGTRKPVEVAYVLLGSPHHAGPQVGFALGAYDRNRPVVIDPVVSYSTYLGGTSTDGGLAVAVRDGHTYVTGYTDSINFPPSGGAQNNQAGQDAFVVKLDASGTGLAYATYIGGGGEDAGTAIAVDSAGQAYVTGYTDSTNFPTVPATPLLGNQGFRDAFVVKLNAAGTGFAYSTYLGGGADDQGLGIAVDAAGSAHVTGGTSSTDFPTTTSAFQGDQPLRDAFVTKLSPTGTSLVYSTYVGGDGDDEGHAVAVDASGRIHITGGSNSANLPKTANSRAHGGAQDAFVATFDPSASGLASRTFLTYFGGSGEDAGRGIAVDSAGLIHITGSTASANFPTKPTTAYQSTPGGGEDVFVVKLDPAGLGPNQVTKYSSLLGGSGDEAGYGIALDEEGQVYVTGFTTSANFPTRHAAATGTQLGGTRDAFVAKFERLDVEVPSLRYSTYLGGSGDDDGFGVALDAAGNAYVAGLTRSGNLPQAVGSLSGPEDAFVARLSEPDLVIAVLTAPATAGAGGTISVAAVTRNIGAVPTRPIGAVAGGESTTSFYLSTDNRLNPSLDTFLGSYAVPALGASEEHALDPPLMLTLPAGLPAATYFLFASADAADAVGESFESNNKTRREIVIGPDLTVSALAVTSFGSTMTVTDTTRNAGGATAAASTTSFFLSSATGEVPLGSRPVGSLGPGLPDPATIASVETALPIPLATATGSYTVIARADAGGAVVETSEANNSRSAPFDVGVDLIVSALADVPSATGAGKSFTIKSTTTNRGFIASGPSTTEFFLSTAADETGVRIGTVAIPALGRGEADTLRPATVTIPPTTLPGSYFVVAKANSGIQPLVETRTTNNTRSRATVIGPDLQVYYVFPAAITSKPGGTFLYKDTTRNFGAGDAPASVTKYYMSSDATLDPGDTELSQRPVSLLEPGKGDVNSAGVLLTVPPTTTAGNYFVIARANAGATPIAETDGTNNTRTSTLTVAGVDLVVSALTVALGGGSTLIITDTTENQGTASAEASITTFYLSTDDAIFDETKDAVLGSRSVGILAGGATSPATTTVPLPAGIAPGTYTVFAVADAGKTVPEGDESNNRRSRVLDTRGSDLVVSALTGKLTGTTLTVSDTTRNEGPGTAGASTTRIYLSPDTTWDSSDVPLGPGRSVVSLAAANESTRPSVLTIPATTAGGAYFVIARADDANVVGEVNEGNNTASLAVTINIRPDLTFSEFNVPAAAAGVTFNVDGRVSNDGAIPVGPSVLKIFMSTDDTLDGGDALLATRTIEALAPTRNSTFNIPVTLPAGTTAARIIGKVNADDQIAESNDTNNTRVKAVAVGADLIILALTGPNPSVAGAGSTIVVRDTTRSRVAESGPTITRIYLATQAPDPTTGALPAGAIEIGSRSIPTLGAGRNHTADTSVTIPPGTQSGVYFIIAMADADRRVTEGNETNNATCPTPPAPCPSGAALSLSIVIGPDLVVSGVTAPPRAEGNAAITVTDTTSNQGGVLAGDSTTTFYLSTNTTFESTDVLLESRSVGALGAGASSPGSTSLSIPAGTPPGTYHVVVRADAGGAVSEVSEGNNTAASGPILIGVDLTVTITVPPTTGAGAVITVKDIVTNIGGAQAGESVLKFSLSPGDSPLGSRIVPALAGGAASEGNTQVTIPVDASAAVYAIVATVDANLQVAELNEANNVASAELKTGPDLQVTVLTVPAEAAPGSVITIKDTTKNFGAAAGVSVTRFFVSTDANLDSGDIPLGPPSGGPPSGRAVPALGFGAASLGTTDVTLPATLTPGAYHIIARADATDALVEALEDNNIRTRPISIGADLTISAVTAPGQSGRGKSITVGVSTKNLGAAIGPSVTHVYLSTNDQLSGDTFLRSVDVPALAANGTKTLSIGVTIPDHITTVGTHFIIAKANGDSAVGEVDTANNTKARSIVLGPDLLVPTLTPQTTGGVGLPFTISDTTRNDGGGDALASITEYYVSANGEFDSNSVRIGSRNVPALLAGASSAGSVTLTLPALPPPAAGSYLVFAVANSGGLPEFDTLNNTRSKQTKIGPDLVISTLTSPASAGPGSQPPVAVTIVNQGAGNAVAFAVRVYLSTDDEFTPGVDEEVGSASISGVLAGASTPATPITVRIPPGVSGPFSLIAVADPENAIAELSEANNQKRRSINVVP